MRNKKENMEAATTTKKGQRRPKASKEEGWAEYMDRLRTTPEDQLSSIAKYWLAHEHDEPVKLNMRYVMK